MKAPLTLKGKTIDGILITQHKTAIANRKVGKEELAKYEATRKASAALASFRNIPGTLTVDPEIGGALNNLDNMLRNTRRVFTESKEGGKQTISFEFPLPLNVAIQLFKSGERKLEYYQSKKWADEMQLAGDMSISSVIKKIKDRRSREIKKARTALKKPLIPGKSWDVALGNSGERQTYQFKLTAGCHTVPGEILNFKLAKGKPGVRLDKKPKTKDHHVGIELEFVSKLNAHSLGLKLLVEGLGEWVQLKGDGSVRDESGNGYFPHEICICVPEDKMEMVVEKVCKILNEAGSMVNKTCGFHVHLDMRYRDKNIAFANLVSSQSILYAMQPSVRRENKFCRKTESKKFDVAYREAGGDGNGRYKGINPAAMERHQTLEIRIHSGTTNARKIKNWVNLLVGIVSTKTVISEDPKNATSMSKLFELPPAVASYVQERMDKFKKKDVGIENEDNGEAA